jgi:hypothetical protein
MEVERLTDRLNNVRRLQEVGALHSGPSYQNNTTYTPSNWSESPHNPGSFLIQGNNSESPSASSTPAQARADTLHSKIQMYTSELHSLLDQVENVSNNSQN